ncbi:MAG: hypothetical protein AB1782_09245 [Cyanobacteriota bacterium]
MIEYCYNRGNALSQYSIIIALIALTLVPVFFFTGNYIFKNFEIFSNLLKGNQTETKALITQNINDSPEISESNNTSEHQPQINNVNNKELTGDKILSDQLGGNLDSPVIKCSNRNCSIDYGDFVLNGIPEDFGSFVEASGTSGGTEKLAAILEQIAVQLEQKGDTAGSKDFRDLANTLHIVARIDKSIESDLSERIKTGGSIFYPPQVKFNESDIKMLEKIYPDWKYSNTKESTDIIFEIIGDGPLDTVGNITYITNRIEQGTYSANMKAIMNYCYDNAYKLNYNTTKILSESVTLEDANNFIHPKPSEGTHSNASIICVTGNNKDNSHYCRK